MIEHRAIVAIDGDEATVDIRDLDQTARAVLFAALQDSCATTMAKAHTGEGPDPRFPEADKLIREMRRIWDHWSDWLVGRFVATRPNTTGRAAVLRQHQAGAIAQATGIDTDPDVTEHLVHIGTLPPDYQTEAPVSHAVRLGTSLDPYEQPDPTPRAPRATPDPVHATAGLTPEDRIAVRYAQERAAVFMRRPVSSLHLALSRAELEARRGHTRNLTEEERSKIGATVAQALQGRASVAETARRLKDATKGTSLTNDMDRVARTELHFAHAFGAYAQLRSMVPPGDDPMVYKIINRGACTACRRIWGHSANPKHYKLSAIEARERDGGNFGLPAAKWGPTIGPTHPNCTCGGLHLWNPAVHAAVQDVAAAMRARNV